MSNIYIVESVNEVDGGYLPENRRTVAIFSSLELAEDYIKNNESDFENYEIDEWPVYDASSEVSE